MGGRSWTVTGRVLLAVLIIAFTGWRAYRALNPDEPETRYLCSGITTTTFVTAAGIDGRPTTPDIPPPPRLSDEPC